MPFYPRDARLLPPLEMIARELPYKTWRQKLKSLNDSTFVSVDTTRQRVTDRRTDRRTDGHTAQS